MWRGFVDVSTLGLAVAALGAWWIAPPLLGLVWFQVPALVAAASVLALLVGDGWLARKADGDGGWLGIALGPGWRCLVACKAILLLALGLCASVALLVLWDDHGRTSLPLHVALPATFGAAAAVGGARVFRLGTDLVASWPADSIRLARAEAPTLWAVIDRAAAALGRPGPDSLALSLAIAPSLQVLPAHPLDRDRAGRGEEVVLHLSLHLLAIADAAELAAIVAHELAHADLQGAGAAGLAVTRWHVLLGLGTARTDTGERLLPPAFAGLAHGWAHRLAEPTMALSRAAELAADAAAARALDPTTVARALLRVALFEGVAERAVTDLAQFGGDGGRVDALAALAAARAARRAAVDPGAALGRLVAPQEAAGFASHPPLAQRLAAIGGNSPQPGWLDPPAETVLQVLPDAALLAGRLARHVLAPPEAGEPA